jgi:hypothetical protein
LDLTAQFTAIFTGCGIHSVATARKIAAGVDSPSDRRSYGDHKQGAHPVAAEAKARSDDPRREDASALTRRRSSASSRSRPGGDRRLRPEQAAGE